MKSGEATSDICKHEGDSEQKILLEVRNLDVSVNDGGNEKLLSTGITIQLPPGKILPLVGPSGIGKSTFLRTIVRLHPAKKGCLFYRGEDIREMSPPLLRRKIGMLLQKPTFLPGDVEVNLLDAYSFKHVELAKPSHDDLIEVLEKVSLEADILVKDVHSLSGGEAQRVALARLLLLKPEILLLDEPTSNLDERSSLCIADSIKNWSNETGGSAIWIVHEREVLKQIGEEKAIFTKEGIRQSSNGGQE